MKVMLLFVNHYIATSFQCLHHYVAVGLFPITWHVFWNLYRILNCWLWRMHTFYLTIKSDILSSECITVGSRIIPGSPPDNTSWQPGSKEYTHFPYIFLAMILIHIQWPDDIIQKSWHDIPNYRDTSSFKDTCAQCVNMAITVNNIVDWWH